MSWEWSSFPRYAVAKNKAFDPWNAKIFLASALSWASTSRACRPPCSGGRGAPGRPRCSVFSCRRRRRLRQVKTRSASNFATRTSVLSRRREHLVERLVPSLPRVRKSLAVRLLALLLSGAFRGGFSPAGAREAAPALPRGVEDGDSASAQRSCQDCTNFRASGSSSRGRSRNRHHIGQVVPFRLHVRPQVELADFDSSACTSLLMSGRARPPRPVGEFVDPSPVGSRAFRSTAGRPPSCGGARRRRCPKGRFRAVTPPPKAARTSALS